MKSIRDQLEAIERDMVAIARPASELAYRHITPAARREANLADADVMGALMREDARALVKDELQPTPALEAVKRWFNTRSTGLRGAGAVMVLLGGCGRGKTVAAAWLLARLGAGRYIVTEQACRMSQAARADAWEKLLATSVVVLDDAGVESDIARAEMAMYEFVNKRLDLERGWSVITSNLTWRDFTERFGQRTARRLEHGGQIKTIEGPDLRRRPGRGT